MSALLQVQIEQAPELDETIESVLTRGVSVLMPETGLSDFMIEPIRLYLGIDPTSPKLHIGHMVPLRKLRQFQRLGHYVHLLFGDFTAMIGDPSDKTAARKRLTVDQVAANVADYKRQAGMVLDLSPDAQNPVEIVYNASWLRNLSFLDAIELASHFTVNELVRRQMYKVRLDNGIPLYLHEFFYSLMQGYDSVALDVRLEVGGKDQLTNMLAGTTLMHDMANQQKWVMGMALIEGPDGQKMGKTTGGVVNIDEYPEVIYEAMMSWPDNMIALGLELLTGVPMFIVEAVKTELEQIASGSSDTNPSNLKHALAFRVVKDLTGEADAEYARTIFNQVKRQKQLPERMREVSVATGLTLTQILVEIGLARDLDEARSKLTQQAVRIDGKQSKKDYQLASGEYVIELGKNSIRNIRKVFVA